MAEAQAKLSGIPHGANLRRSRSKHFSISHLFSYSFSIGSHNLINQASSKGFKIFIMSGTLFLNFVSLLALLLAIASGVQGSTDDLGKA
jgi:hypothetical protein